MKRAFFFSKSKKLIFYKNQTDEKYFSNQKTIFRVFDGDLNIFFEERYF